MPHKLLNIICSSNDNNNSLYIYLTENYGYPRMRMHNADYMDILLNNYIVSLNEYELKDEIQINYTSENEEKGTESNEDLGDVDVFYYTGERAPEYIEGFHLLVKSVNGDNIYYICKDKKKYLVYKNDIEIRGWMYNARAGDNYILVNPAWPLKKSSINPEPDPAPTPNPSPEPTPQPRLQRVQVWVPCPTCHNSGQCQTCYGQGWTYSASDRYYDGKAPCYNCGGSKKCTTCAGQGGHYEVEYR